MREIVQTDVKVAALNVIPVHLDGLCAVTTGAKKERRRNGVGTEWRRGGGGGGIVLVYRQEKPDGATGKERERSVWGEGCVGVGRKKVVAGAADR